MRYQYLLIAVICFNLSCLEKRRSTNLRELVLAHAPKINGTLITLNDEHEINKMPPLDTVFIPFLSKQGVLQPDQYKKEGCLNSLHYYGYFELNDKYTCAVFAYAICTCCGDDQLILAVLDKRGNIMSAIKAAEYTSPSECRIETTTEIKGTRLTVAGVEECTIFEGPNKGLSSIDSTTLFYEVAQNGRLYLKKQDSVHITR